MSKISIKSIKSAKRPVYLTLSDLEKTKIKVTEEELKTLPIIKEWCEKLGLEKSNIPDLFTHIFSNTVMIQILDPITNRTICVGDEGQKVNTNPIGKDYECVTCDHFQKTEKHPNGQCMWAYNRFKEKFGENRPKGLTELVEKSKMQNSVHEPLTQEEVLQLTEGVSNDISNPRSEI